MADAASVPKSTPPKKDGASATKPPKRKKQSIFADPVVRAMLFLCMGLVIAYLLFLLGVLSSGVLTKTGPRSAAERDLMITSSAITPQTTGEAWVPYIESLVAVGDYGAARTAIKQAYASNVGTLPVSGINLAEARLLFAQNDYKGAVNIATKAMTNYGAERKLQKGEKALEYEEGYYNAALVKAYALEKTGDFKTAVKMYDEYLSMAPTAADILTDRGNAKLKTGDKKGAAADFKLALKFVPYDQEAKAGLKQIGAAK